MRYFVIRASLCLLLVAAAEFHPGNQCLNHRGRQIAAGVAASETCSQAMEFVQISTRLSVNQARSVPPERAKLNGSDVQDTAMQTASFLPKELKIGAEASAAKFAERRLAYRTALSRKFVALPPQMVEGPTPVVPSGSNASVEWERIQLQVEPGKAGRLILLIAKPAASPGPKPAVLIHHSTGSAKELLAVHLERYALKGFVAVAFDLRYHGERALANAGLPEPFTMSIKSLGPKLDEAVAGAEEPRLIVYYKALVNAWKTGDEKPFIYDMVSDGYRVIDYLTSRKDVDASRIGATGISLGGMVTWLLAASDERIAAVAPAIGVQSFRYAVEKNLWRPRINTILPVFEMAATDLGKDEVDTEVVKAVWKKILPGMLDGNFDAEFSLPCIAPRPLLILNGERDPRCCIDGVRGAVAHAAAEYEAQGARSSIRHFVEEGVEHSMTANMWREIDGFMEESLLSRSESDEQRPPTKKSKV